MTVRSSGDLPYRPCVGVFLINGAGQVFIARRNDQPQDAWQMPQGGIDPGEAPADAAIRELEEEIGTGNAEIIGETDQWLKYDLPPQLIGRVWKGRYRGQTQKWFAMRYRGTDADIRPETVAEPEFDAWRWAGADEIVPLAVDFKREIYARVVTEFRHLL